MLWWFQEHLEIIFSKTWVNHSLKETDGVGNLPARGAAS